MKKKHNKPASQQHNNILATATRTTATASDIGADVQYHKLNMCVPFFLLCKNWNQNNFSLGKGTRRKEDTHAQRKSASETARKGKKI